LGNRCLFSNIMNTYVVIIKWLAYLIENLFITLMKQSGNELI